MPFPKARLILISREVSDPEDLRPFMPSEEGWSHFVVMGYQGADDIEAKYEAATLSLREILRRDGVLPGIQNDR